MPQVGADQCPLSFPLPQAAGRSRVSPPHAPMESTRHLLARLSCSTKSQAVRQSFPALRTLAPASHAWLLLTSQVCAAVTHLARAHDRSHRACHQATFLRRRLMCCTCNGHVNAAAPMWVARSRMQGASAEAW